MREDPENHHRMIRKLARSLLALGLGWIACELAFIALGTVAFTGERLELAMIDAIVVVPILYVAFHAVWLGASRVFAGRKAMPLWLSPMFGIAVGVALGLIEWRTPLSNHVPRGIL